ncbi:7TM diverse intracellular signaling domain-containing protein [Chryseosolibacter indicus]|uniref:Transposase n=1 Tax=Chryseosolibacter indicus TaxID=2782351 RepID=A0ABS5VQN2_9BACT|nr:7TM diverse intracellular signaling domain-containing protein [Chryseosolibacter indicus]MBT1703160.1 transposase [Chryseosolibacter indicus]
MSRIDEELPGLIMKQLLLGVLLLFSFVVHAQPVAVINESIDEHNFMPYELSFLVDSTNNLQFDDLHKPEMSERFKQHSDYQNKDFKTNASYWIKLPVQITSETSKVWLFEFYDQTIDHIEAYVPQADGSYKKIIMGDSHPFSKRMFMHKNFEVMLNSNLDSSTVYYFKIKSHTFADIRVALRSVNRFVYYSLNEYFLFGTFYGMILIISLYNFLIFVAIREIKNIFYIMYILSVAAYAMSYDGIGFQYLWPNHPEWNKYAVGITLYSVILWGLIFTRRFLSTRTNYPKLDKALVIMIVARSAFFVVELFAFPDLLTFRNIEIIPLSLIFYTGITVWRRGYRPARFFVIAYGILFSGFFIRTLVYFNILPFTTLSHYSLHFSFVLEMLFLTFALGDRIRILKNMRDRALKRIIYQHEENVKLKDQVNRELEQKVQERTLELNQKNKELEEMNKKLEQQSREINEINSILDLDNWKLKNSIKEVLNERLLEKTMDYKQFRTLYPDSLACYRFLENLKWEKGFSCRKCSNEKYFSGTQKFARRCTKCGYNESITAYTIFHSLKFQIEKGFYIAYLTVTAKKDYTLESLSEQLELRTNTVWSFKHKVQDRIAELEKRGKKPHASGWEEVIMITESTGKSSSKRTKDLPEEVL